MRVCYGILKGALYCPNITKVVFIPHSQGGIKGDLMLDWLLQELPWDLLAKFEVFTFGNVADHFNNLHRAVDAQNREAATFGPYAAPTLSSASAFKTAPYTLILMAQSSSSHPATLIGQTFVHIEHYAHTSGFVAL